MTGGGDGGIVFLGTDDVAAACLDRVVRSHRVALAVVPPDRRRGRRGRPVPAPAARRAAALDVAVLATADVNDDASLARIAAADPALLVVVAFGQILRQPLLDLAPVAINLHFSLLPRWRGASPVHHAILADDTVTGVSVQRIILRLDAGPVLAHQEEPVGPRDTTASLRERLTHSGASLLTAVADDILRGEPPVEVEQDEAAATVAPRIDRAAGRLDFAGEDAWALDRRIRALGDWPGCRAVLRRHDGATTDIRVRAAAPEAGGGSDPGAVLAAGPDGIVVAAARGALRISRLQRPGGKELGAAAFLNGWPVAAGDRALPIGS